ncbi:hypothetical protein J4Q44_G00390290 [Coregonus suidteri]|uniref:G protein-regulated inducer of neurite outgrowth C-terminal domain-containing protein n=1 Tax=Coregonus suidteri TaxID=861788 RepID=A0AAN8KF91_9TELE
MEKPPGSKQRTVVAQMESPPRGGGVATLDVLGNAEPNASRGAEPKLYLQLSPGEASPHVATDTRKLNGGRGSGTSPSCLRADGTGNEGSWQSKGGSIDVRGGGVLKPLTTPERADIKKSRIPMALSPKTDTHTSTHATHTSTHTTHTSTHTTHTTHTSHTSHTSTTSSDRRLRSPKIKHGTIPKTHTHRTEHTWDASSKVEHSRTEHLSAVSSKPSASRTVQGSKDPQKVSSSKGPAPPLAPLATSSPKCRTTVDVMLTSTTSDIITGGRASNSDLSMGSLRVKVNTPHNTPFLTPDPFATATDNTETTLEDAARRLESKMAAVSEGSSIVTMISQSGTRLLGGGVAGGPTLSQKAVQQSDRAATCEALGRDVNPPEYRRGDGRSHDDCAGRLPWETKPPGAPLGDLSHVGDVNVIAITGGNNDEASSRAMEKGRKEMGRKEEEPPGSSRERKEAGTMTNPSEVRRFWGEERREVGVQAVVEVCDRSATTSPRLSLHGHRGNAGEQEGVVTDGQRDTDSRSKGLTAGGQRGSVLVCDLCMDQQVRGQGLNGELGPLIGLQSCQSRLVAPQNQETGLKPVASPLCCIPIGLAPFQHVCQIDIELCSQSELPNSNDKLPTTNEELPTSVTNDKQQKPSETLSKTKTRQTGNSASKTSHKHRNHSSPSHSSHRTHRHKPGSGRDKQKPGLEWNQTGLDRLQADPAPGKSTTKLTSENPEWPGDPDQERKDSGPVQNVVWDEQGMTWEVYGASVDLESLGFAIQSHLQCKIQEHEKRIGTLRKSVSQEVPSPGAKKWKEKKKKKKRNVFRSICRPGCCRKPPASPAGK